ncbi:MAG: PfkB family carbohydrate kinase [Kibdelosporangium sp.]
MTGRLVHTGQVVVDLVLRVDELPPAGGDVLASEFLQTAGGGFNVMVAAARSGAEVIYAGSHGSGNFGDIVRIALASEGITVAQPITEPDTGISVALVDATGERTFVTGPGAEGQVAEIASDHSDIIYVTGYSLTHRHNSDALADWLPEAPGLVLFDPGPLVADIPDDVWRRILPHVDVLSSNATEAAKLPQVDIPIRVRRDGPRGCEVTCDGKTVHIPGFPVTAVDTNGAGDAHTGVLAAELLHGNNIEDAARRANAAAAIAVTRKGPATAPTRAEIDCLTRAQ